MGTVSLAALAAAYGDAFGLAADAVARLEEELSELE